MFMEKEFNIFIKENEKNSSVQKYFLCMKCRNATKCENLENCKLAAYIDARLPQVEYKYDATPAQINITVADRDEFDRARIIVNRAMRLREHKCGRAR